VSGLCIARPYHKFFNYNERTETEILPEDIQYHCLDKIDGSMIFPLYLSTGTRLATKAGITDISMFAENFIATKSNYMDFIENCKELKLTPIFEYVSDNNRIVIDYKKENLILTGIRYIVYGEYYSFQALNNVAYGYKIPVVKESFNKNTRFDYVYESIKNNISDEGIVLVFEDGHRMKIKSDWYVSLHRYIDIMRSDRHLLKAYLSEEWDDIYSNSPGEIRDKIDVGINKFKFMIDEFIENQYEKLLKLPNYSSSENDKNSKELKKEFALVLLKNNEHGIITSAAFKSYEFLIPNHQKIALKNSLLNSVRRRVKNEKNFAEVIENIFPNGIKLLDSKKDNLDE
jgi:T4 RnlA family RNA ligase